MIKVLKRGKAKRKQCKRCESKLEYEMTDVKKDNLGVRMGFNPTYYIECPICKNRLYVKG